MTFHNTDPEEYLSSYSGEPYDYVVFFLSLWFFSDPSRIARLLTRLSSGHHGGSGVVVANRLLIAEWALQASSAAAWPHLLAALSIATLETRNIEDKSNVCSPVSPAWFRALFAAMGLEMEREELVVPGEEFRDGMWEVRVVLSESHAVRLGKVYGENERGRLVAEAMQEAVRATVGRLEGGLDKVQSMDIWTCVVPLGAASSGSRVLPRLCDERNGDLNITPGNLR
jgi:hypothetical protein